MEFILITDYLYTYMFQESTTIWEVNSRPDGNRRSKLNINCIFNGIEYYCIDFFFLSVVLWIDTCIVQHRFGVSMRWRQRDVTIIHCSRYFFVQLSLSRFVLLSDLEWTNLVLCVRFFVRSSSFSNRLFVLKISGRPRQQASWTKCCTTTCSACEILSFVLYVLCSERTNRVLHIKRSFLHSTHAFGGEMN